MFVVKLNVVLELIVGEVAVKSPHGMIFAA